MKKVLFAALIMVVSVVASNASDLLVAESNLALIRTQIQAQIERIQRACERAEARTTLAQMRAEEQLRIAEEDLTLQVERLEMLREQLSDQAGATGSAAAQSEQNLKQTVERDLQEIGNEIRKANDLIQKLRRLRESSSTDVSAQSSANGGSTCSDSSNRDLSTDSTSSVSGLGSGAQTDLPSIAELETMLLKIQQEQPVQNQPTSIAALPPPPPIVRTG